MQLYVFRHAWAEPLSPDYPDEEARPLTTDGQERFERFVERLAAAGVTPQRIGHSPLVRARQTAEILARSHGRHAALEALEGLVPDADLAALVEWTAGVPATDTAWVGHAPDVGQLVAELTGSARPLDFGVGAVASIEFAGTPAAGSGRLRWFAEAALFGI